MSEHSYTSGSIPKAVLSFAGPFLGGIILQNLYGAVDLLVVGRFATTAAVSAVTTGSQLMAVVTQFVLGFATGTTVLVGRYFGAGDRERLGRTVGNNVLLFSGFAAFLTAVFLLFHRGIITLMQTPAPAVPAARQYLLLCSVGIPFIVGFNLVASILMGKGDTRTPLLFMAVACAINIVGDLILVAGFQMGAAGAAVATTAAQAGAFLFSLLYLRRRDLGFPLTRRELQPDRTLLRETIRIGTPVAVQDVLVNLSFLFITAIINGMGLVPSAAAGVVEKLFSFLMMPAIAAGAAVSTIAAQNLGARRPDRARESMWCAVGMSLLPSVVIVVFCQLGGTLLTRPFSADPQVVAMAALYLRTYCLDTVAASFVFAINGYFNSCGYAWFTLAHSLATTFALRIPITWAVSRIPGVSLLPMGWAAPASTAASLVLCLLFLRWMKRHPTALTGQRA